MRWAGLGELGDASHLHDGGFPLPCCKAIGLLTLRVGASKSFAVAIEDLNLPMTVLPPLIFPKFRTFPDIHLAKYYHPN